ncbi:U3 small nucleolar RNA-associated protein 25, partial [Dissostichus eleginoides]
WRLPSMTVRSFSLPQTALEEQMELKPRVEGRCCDATTWHHVAFSGLTKRPPPLVPPCSDTQVHRTEARGGHLAAEALQSDHLGRTGGRAEGHTVVRGEGAPSPPLDTLKGTTSLSSYRGAHCYLPHVSVTIHTTTRAQAPPRDTELRERRA